MPALPPTPVRSSPKVTSTLANTAVVCEKLKKFTPAETSPQTSCEIVLEAEGAARGDQCRLIVVCEVAPQAADDEGLHQGAGPGLHGGAGAQTQAASDIGIVIEGDGVAAEAEPVDVRPHHLDRGQRLEEGAAREAAEAVAGVGAHAQRRGVEGIREAERGVGSSA